MTLSSEGYIDHVKAALNHSPIIATWVILNELTLGDRGHIRVRITLKNGDFVEASEFFSIQETGIEQQRYRYQWMDQTKTKLRKRWDNAPHFPEIGLYWVYYAGVTSYTGEDDATSPNQTAKFARG